MRDALAALLDKSRDDVRSDALDMRDPVFIQRIAPLMDLFYDHYFRCETERVLKRLVSPCCNAPVCPDSEHWAESLALKCKECDKPLPGNW